MTKQNKPTKSELAILSILWEKETATVREVYEIINERKPTAYTTVLKLMQIMFEKGLGQSRRFKPRTYFFGETAAGTNAEKSRF